jgi:hypothetical protein
MATVKSFEDLEIWKLARPICKKLAPIIKRLRLAREYRLADQMSSSSGSSWIILQKVLKETAG